MSLAPAGRVVLPALKPPRPAPVADTSWSSGGVSTRAPGAGSPRPRRPSAARARIGCTATTPASPSQRGDQTDAHPAGRDPIACWTWASATPRTPTSPGWLVDHRRRQMTAAHPAPVATIPIPYTKGRRS
jgi:hypothetical protein